MSSIASTDDLEAAWRPLSDEEITRAEMLIERAERMIRRRWPDVAGRIAAGTLDADDVSDVVLEMVQSAMSAPPGAESYSQAAGPFSESVKYANPLGRLFFTAEMVRVFDGTRVGRAFSVDLTPGC